MSHFFKWNWQKLELELDVLKHGLKGLLGFVFIRAQEEKHFLLIKVLLIVGNLFLCTILMEFFEFSFLVVIMLTLSIKIESGSLFIKYRLLLLFCVK